MNWNAGKNRKNLFLLSGILCIFLTTACGIFRKSESEKEFEAWKEEAKNNSQPDPVRQEQTRSELDELVARSSAEQESDAQTVSRPNGPPTEAELDALRENYYENPRKTPFGTMYYYLTGIPMFFFYNPSVGP